MRIPCELPRDEVESYKLLYELLVFPSLEITSMAQLVSSPFAVEKFNSSLHSEGMRSCDDIPADTTIFRELPLMKMQTVPNKQCCLCCSHCLRFIGSYSLQFQMLSKQTDRQQILSQLMSDTFKLPLSTPHHCFSDIFSCSNHCGEMYCSKSCRDNHWNSCHRLLCTGDIPEDEADSHTLIRFKVHAIATNEIFLLAADIFANLCIASESSEEAMRANIDVYNNYVRKRWEDCVTASSSQELIELKRTLARLVKESWALLNSALSLEQRGLDRILNEEFLSRTIGMFEQNNVGIRLKNPVLEYVEGLTIESEDLSYVLDMIKEIVNAIDG